MSDPLQGTSTYLTEDEVFELTDKLRYRAQQRALASMGFRFAVRMDGRPMVSRAHHDAMMGAYPARESPAPEPDWEAMNAAASAKSR